MLNETVMQTATQNGLKVLDATQYADLRVMAGLGMAALFLAAIVYGYFIGKWTTRPNKMDRALIHRALMALQDHPEPLIQKRLDYLRHKYDNHKEE